MALCTLDDVKLFLGIELANTASDEVLNALITNSSAFIENYTGRTFAVTEYVENRDGTGNSKMPVYYGPITNVKSVKVYDVEQTVYKNTDTLIWLSNGATFPLGLMNIELTYEAGFATIPDDVKQSCIELVAYKFKQRDRIGLQSKGLAGEMTTYELKDIREDIKNKLAPYVRVV